MYCNCKDIPKAMFNFRKNAISETNLQTKNVNLMHFKQKFAH